MSVLELAMVVVCVAISAALRAWVAKLDAPKPEAQPINWPAFAVASICVVIALAAGMLLAPRWSTSLVTELELPVLVTERNPAEFVRRSAGPPLSLGLCVAPLFAVAWLVMRRGRNVAIGLVTFGTAMLSGISLAALVRYLAIARVNVLLGVSADEVVEVSFSVEHYLGLVSRSVAAGLAYGATAGALAIWTAASKSSRLAALRVGAFVPMAFALVASLATPPDLISTGALLSCGLLSVAVCMGLAILVRRR